MMNNEATVNNEAGRHGSAADRGAADRYYGRGFRPHYRTPSGVEVGYANMTNAEIAAYKRGWDNEDDRKSWD